MTKLNRVTGKVFGGDATATGDNPEIGQFGSALAGTYNGTTDVATIQNLPAWGQGWAGAVTPDTNFPALPEMTGFGKVLSYQQNYILQSGMPEWDNETIYYKNQFCRVGNVFYYSLTDENLGNDPATDTTNWANYLTTLDIFSSNNTFTGLNNFTGGLQTNGIDAANVDASNFTQTGKDTLINTVLPSLSYIDLTLQAGHTIYTAPDNGYVTLWAHSPESASGDPGTVIQIIAFEDGASADYYLLNGVYGTISRASVKKENIAVFLPLRKGVAFAVGYYAIDLTAGEYFFRFIYANGNESNKEES